MGNTTAEREEHARKRDAYPFFAPDGAPLDPDRVARYVAIRRQHPNLREAAKVAGVHHTTMWRHTAFMGMTLKDRQARSEAARRDYEAGMHIGVIAAKYGFKDKRAAYRAVVRAKTWKTTGRSYRRTAELRAKIREARDQ